MKRKDAINTIIHSIGSEDIVVSTTGLISREIFERFDSKRNIYVPGSMGLASSIGMAIAICNPSRKVFVVDGDASLLMNLGTLVTIGNNKPQNFFHIVLDNGAYGSCSEEKSMSCSANLDKIAYNAGYVTVAKVRTVKSLKNAILSNYRGPRFILAKIELGGHRDFARPQKLVAIKKRFMKFIKIKKEKNYDVPRR